MTRTPRSHLPPECADGADTQVESAAEYPDHAGGPGENGVDPVGMRSQQLRTALNTRVRCRRFPAEFSESGPGLVHAIRCRMELLHRELTERIIGVYFDVYTELGFGFLERVCQTAVVIGLRQAGLRVEQNVSFAVWFRGQLIGYFIADIVVEGRVLLEIKAKSALHAFDEAQAINYLRASSLEVALILNFGPKREYRRRILTNSRKSAPRTERASEPQP